MAEKKYIILHHSASTSKKPQFDMINNVHKKKKFPKSELNFYGGYNYLVERDGTIRKYREEHEKGAHTNAKFTIHHLNYYGIGICLAGSFDKEDPTKEQITSLNRLVVGIQERHDIPDGNILLHRDVKATACPGQDLKEMILKEREKPVDLFTRLKQLIHALGIVSDKRRRGIIARTIKRIQKRIG
mgnify:CR=1 FL=1